MGSMVRARAKNIFLSKMFWLGSAEIFAGVAELMLNYLDNPEVGWIFIVKGIGTIVLRYFTKQPVTLTGKATKPVEGV